jgi:hypothetical protein
MIQSADYGPVKAGKRHPGRLEHHSDEALRRVPPPSKTAAS